MTGLVSQTDAPGRVPTRVGVILGDLGKLNEAALKFLIVHLNTLQSVFEFELLAADHDDPLLKFLNDRHKVDRKRCRAMLPDFCARLIVQIKKEQEEYDLTDKSIPEGFILITMARFLDEHYGLKSENVQVQALGNWERNMAPPSIFEFIISLLLRQAASFATLAVSKSVHLGTKGCLFDFTADLGDARYKALQAYICSVCRERLGTVPGANIADEIVRVLDMNWLGKLEDPHSPAGIVAKLGYDLFLTQGLKPTWGETIRAILRDDGTKEVVKLIGGVLLAAILIWLGLKKP